ncbi:MAG: phosphatase PAP2 family protein [Rhodothermales bacterium]
MKQYIYAGGRTRAWVVMGLVVMLFGAGMPAQAQRADLRRYVDWGLRDPIRLARMPDRTSAYILTGALVVVGTISLVDAGITDEVQEGYRGAFKTYTDFTNNFGGPYAVAPVAGVLGVSLLTRNRRFQDAAFTSAQALGYAGLLTIGIKAVIGRHRPADSDSPYVFTPFSGDTSFPSGHTTAVTAILVPWALYYPHPITWALVGFGAGGTALARIAKNRHWASDVAMGGFIGTTMAISLSRLHHRFDDRPMPVQARLGRDGMALTFTF